MTRFGVARTRRPLAGTIPTAVRGKTTSGDPLRMRFEVVHASSVGGHTNSVIVNNAPVKSCVSVTLLLTSRGPNSFRRQSKTNHAHQRHTGRRHAAARKGAVSDAGAAPRV